MSDEVRIEINGTSADAQQAWLQLASVVDKLNQKVQKVQRTGKSAGKDISVSFNAAHASIDQSINRVLGLQATMRSLGTVARMVWQDLKQVAAERGKVFDRNKSAAAGFENLYFNVGDPKEAGRIANKLRSMQSGVPLGDLYAEAGAAISASGNLSTAQAVAVVQEVVKSRPNATSDERQKMAEAALKTLRAAPELQAKDQSDAELEAAAKRAFGFIVGAMPVAPQTEMAMFSDNMIAGMLQMQNMAKGQDNSRFLMSLLIGLGHTSGDTHGQRTRNSQATIKQLYDDMVVAGALGQDASIEDMFKAIRGGGKAREVANARLGVWAIEAKDAEKRSRKAKTADEADSLRGEATMKAALIQMVQAQPDSEFWKQQKHAFDSMPKNGAEMIARLDEMQRESKNAIEFLGAGLDLAIEAEANNASSNAAMIWRAGLAKALDAEKMNGQSPFWVDRKKDLINAGPLGSAEEEKDRYIRVLQAEAAWLRERAAQKDAGILTKVFGGPDAFADDDTREQFRKAADALERIADQAKDRNPENPNIGPDRVPVEPAP